MKFVFLGTGTSQGVPIIGCDCAVCTSSDKRNKRLRTSGYIEHEGTRVLIDIGPDFRYQALRAGLSSFDAALITHEHNDHVAGIDDIRPINFLQKKPLSVYALPRVVGSIKQRFGYVFEEKPYPGAPQMSLIGIDETTFHIGNLAIRPIEFFHGKLPILGYVFNERVGYITDCSVLPDKVIQSLFGIDLLIINALRLTPHHSHFSLSETINIFNKIAPRACYITHMSHALGKVEEIEALLPERMFVGIDALSIELDV